MYRMYTHVSSYKHLRRSLNFEGNQLTGFYMRATLALNGLKKKGGAYSK